MGRRSVIESNPVILKAVNDAIQRGCTIDAITDMLAQMGHEIGRSSVGVHSKKLKAMSDRSRDIRAAADAFASKFGDAGDNQTRLMIQLITTIITESLLEVPQGEDCASPLELQRLASAVKDAISAQKIDAELRSRIRKEAFEEAQKLADTALRKGGALPETLAVVRLAFEGAV
jgi:hypothetical protein